MNNECKICTSVHNCPFKAKGFLCNSALKRKQGFKDACNCIEELLTEMQGEYVTLEMIKNLVNELKDETDM